MHPGSSGSRAECSLAFVNTQVHQIKDGQDAFDPSGVTTTGVFQSFAVAGVL